MAVRGGRPLQRVAITNTVALNGGDAAIAIAIVESLQRVAPSARLELHDAQPDVAGRYFPDLCWCPSLASILGLRRRPRVPVMLNRQRLLLAARLWQRCATRALARGLLGTTERRWIADFATLDAAVSTGGTYLVERYPLGARIFELRMARALGVPTVFFTQSLGPFTDRRLRRDLRSILAGSPLVLLRDARSRDHLLDIGVPDTALHVVADAVFGRTASRPFVPRGARPVRSVAVSVRHWPPRADATDPAVQAFRAAVAAAVTWLVRERNIEVTFLSTCQAVDEHWGPTIQRWPRKWRPGCSMTCGRASASTAGFITRTVLAAAYADFDMASIAMRMHAAILALTAGTPVLPIAYEFNTVNFFRVVGLGHDVIDIDASMWSSPSSARAPSLIYFPAFGLAGFLRVGVDGQRASAHRAEELASPLCLLEIRMSEPSDRGWGPPKRCAPPVLGDYAIRASARGGIAPGRGGADHGMRGSDCGRAAALLSTSSRHCAKGPIPNLTRRRRGGSPST